MPKVDSGFARQSLLGHERETDSEKGGLSTCKEPQVPEFHGDSKSQKPALQIFSESPVG